MKYNFNLLLLIFPVMLLGCFEKIEPVDETTLLDFAILFALENPGERDTSQTKNCEVPENYKTVLRAHVENTKEIYEYLNFQKKNGIDDLLRLDSPKGFADYQGKKPTEVLSKLYRRWEKLKTTKDHISMKKVRISMPSVDCALYKEYARTVYISSGQESDSEKARRLQRERDEALRAWKKEEEEKELRARKAKREEAKKKEEAAELEKFEKGKDELKELIAIFKQGYELTNKQENEFLRYFKDVFQESTFASRYLATPIGKRVDCHRPPLSKEHRKIVDDYVDFLVLSAKAWQPIESDLNKFMERYKESPLTWPHIFDSDKEKKRKDNFKKLGLSDEEIELFTNEEQRWVAITSYYLMERLSKDKELLEKLNNIAKTARDKFSTEVFGKISDSVFGSGPATPRKDEKNILEIKCKILRSPRAAI